MKKSTKSVKKKASKAIVTQDNRFIYAKYDMNANEMKFFMWIVAQLNSQRDKLFQKCEIPLSEIMEIWQRNDETPDYNYIRNLCDSMLKKTYIEDFKILDEKTMKEVNVHQGYTLFKYIRYQEGQGFITYQLNDSLTEYLLDLKRDFTQLKFNDIQQMKSAYSIRIYNMLICELKQNRQSLKINLAVLQNVLEVPKSFYEWINFKRFVLNQAKKDINAKSNIVIFDINIFKTGRKITELEFVFDYKNNETRIQRDLEKSKSFNRLLIKELESLMSKRYDLDKILNRNAKTPKSYGYWKLISYGKEQIADDKEQVFGIFENMNNRNEKLKANLKDFKSIDELKEAQKKAEELFYLDDEALQRVKNFKGFKTGNLFKKI